jgi:hypothetical protein
LSVLIDESERAVESGQPCPLWGIMLLPKILQKHLGKHMEQIALFVIPGSFEEDGDDDKDNDEDNNDDEEDDDRDDLGDNDHDAKNDQSEESAVIPAEDEDSRPSEHYSVNQDSFMAAAESGDMETVKVALIPNKIDINLQNN